MNVLAAQISVTLLYILSMLSSVYRLVRRRKTAQIGSDDYVAGLALFFSLMYFPTLWFPTNNLFRADVPREEVVFAIVGTWLIQLAWPLLMWTTRISLGLSIVRIMPPKSVYFYAPVALMWMLVVATLCIVCISAVTCATTYHSWSKMPPYVCKSVSTYYVIFACTDVISDLLIVVVPIWALWKRIKLTQKSRRVIFFGFGANGLTALASTILAILMIGHKVKHPVGATRIVPYVMSVISILACNSLVVITTLYRLVRPATEAGPKPNVHQVSTPRTPRDQTTQDMNLNSSLHSNAGMTSNSGMNSEYIATCTSVLEQTDLESSSSPSRLTLTVLETDPSLYGPGGVKIRGRSRCGSQDRYRTRTRFFQLLQILDVMDDLY